MAVGRVGAPRLHGDRLEKTSELQLCNLGLCLGWLRMPLRSGPLGVFLIYVRLGGPEKSLPANLGRCSHADSHTAAMRERLRSPFRRLRNFALSKQGSKDAKEAPAPIDEGPLPGVVKCMQDATDMRLKYEGLLTNGQIISGSAYDFSRSLQDMASYMEESFGEVVDQEIGNIFSLLAKVQFEMSKLLDLFAAHVSKTIIKPTELLMTKIQQAEIMKNEYDEERKLYILSLMEKKAKAKKGNRSVDHQQSLVDEKSIQVKANLLTLYMQSLMRGQSVNLVDQAVKYHSAHMHLFSKGYASINAVEPMIKQVALDRMIDTTLSEEDVSINDFMNSSEMNTKSKVQKYDSQSHSAASSPRHRLVEQTASPCYLSDSSEEIYSRRSAFASKSAPVSPLLYHSREAKENVQESATLDNEHESVAMYALPSPLNECGRQVGDNASTRSEKHSGVLVSWLEKPEKLSGEILEASNKEEHRSDMSVNQLSYAQRQQEHSDTRGKNLTDCTDEDGLYKPIVEKDRRSPLFSYTTGNLSPPSASTISISELHPLPPPGSKTPPKSPNHPANPITHSAPLGKIKQYVQIRYATSQHSESYLPTPISSIQISALNVISYRLVTYSLRGCATMLCKRNEP
ncbi:hypothetical protein GOP47_0021570 [Adiantum capillus-veneris]|uniref:BAR domain-containing protein n=1 Tax=Adiantum capillus-veneris TaxID=13818 RepID=A0A9D4Z5D3_ADICA|nr:hypothetical protein GOP47_0021570 [Adiantum capillus-veneris]